MAHSVQCFPATLAVLAIAAPKRNEQSIIAAGAGVDTDIGQYDMRNPLAISALDDLLLEIFEGSYTNTTTPVFLYLPARSAPVFLIVPEDDVVVSVRVKNITGAHVAFAWRASLAALTNHDEGGAP